MKINLPGIFWIVLILALIPAVSAVIDQFWPASQYYISAIVIAVLGALAKAIQVMLEKGADTLIETPPMGAAAAPTPMRAIETNKIVRLLFG